MLGRTVRGGDLTVVRSLKREGGTELAARKE